MTNGALTPFPHSLTPFPHFRPGKISLENQGGFASIRTRPADLKLDGYDTIALRVKGDGRTYYLDLRTSSRRAAASYRGGKRGQDSLMSNGKMARRAKQRVLTPFLDLFCSQEN